jgi:folate-dependent phosphoribosylglycinamide formyltransferase PurN
MGRLVNGRQEGHAPDFSLTRHEAKVFAERKEKEKKVAKSALVSIVETRESDFVVTNAWILILNEYKTQFFVYHIHNPPQEYRHSQFLI